MKKTRYYFKMGDYYNDNIDWAHICTEAAKQGILLYKDKKTKEMYSYESLENVSLVTGTFAWEIIPLRQEEVEIEQKVTKLPMKNRYANGYNWKAHKKAMNPALQKVKKASLEEEKKKRDLLWTDYQNVREAKLNKKKKRKGKNENDK